MGTIQWTAFSHTTSNDDNGNDAFHLQFFRSLKDRNASFRPFIGLSHHVRICDNHRVFVVLDVGLDWFNVEKQSVGRNENVPVPLLNEREGTIAGIRLPGGLRHEITDDQTKEKVEAVLRKLTFHVRYESPVRADKARGECEVPSFSLFVTAFAY